MFNGTKKSLFYKVAPCNIGLKGNKSLIDSNSLIDCKDYNDYNQYIYESNIYHKLIKRLNKKKSKYSDNVIKLYGYGVTKANNPKFIVRLNNGDLLQTYETTGSLTTLDVTDHYSLDYIKSILTSFGNENVSYQILEFDSDLVSISKKQYTDKETDKIDALLDNVATLANEFYKIGFVHYDLHGHNCLVHKTKQDIPNIKFFDFDMSLIKDEDKAEYSYSVIMDCFPDLYDNICEKNTPLFFKIGIIYDYYRIYADNYLINNRWIALFIKMKGKNINAASFLEIYNSGSYKERNVKYLIDNMKTKINVDFTETEKRSLINKLKINYTSDFNPFEMNIYFLIWCYFTDNKGQLLK